MSLNDRVILITGGASGIGRASALKLAEAGARLAILDISRENGEKLVQELKKKGKEAVFFKCDVTSEESVREAVKGVVEKYGRIDVAFLNAGIEGPVGKVPDINLKDWKRVFDININGLFISAKYVIPVMKKQGQGNIIITSSNLGMSALPDHAAYCSTKGAAIMFGKALAVDYRKENIRVNIVCPGPVLTPLVTSRWEKIEDPVEREKVKEAIMQIPNLLEPEHIADTVVFLASDASSGYSGETFVIDLGAKAELAE